MSDLTSTYWHPIPQVLAVDLMAHRWTPENPAPDAVGFVVAFDRARSGAPWSVRKLAACMGWKKHHAHRVLLEAKAYLEGWESRTQVGIDEWTPKTSKHNNLDDNPGRIPDTFRTDSGHHARGSTNTHTEQNRSSLNKSSEVDQHKTTTKAPRVTAERVDLSGIWEKLEDIRLEARPGSNRAPLGKRRDILRLRVQEHGAEALLHVWRWWWTSSESRPEFLRSKGYSYSTFFRAQGLREYVDLAREWDPKTEGSGGWFDDLEFDETGNVVNFNPSK